MILRLMILLAVSAFAFNSFACTCAPIDQYVQESFDGSKQVFLGIAQSAQATGDDATGSFRTRFKIISSFKGTKRPVDVTTSRSSASCGMSFDLSSALYLVFATTDEKGVLHTSLCRAAAVDTENMSLIRTLEQLADLD